MNLFKWTANFAYAIGLITTDGNLSKDKRHIIFVSKDLNQVKLLLKIFNKQNKISLKTGGYTKERIYHYTQIGDVKLYKFFESIGLSPNKSKTIGELKIPVKYFADFLRGHFDGDGCIYSFWDKRWKKSFLVNLSFVSASEKHIIWLQEKILKQFKINGTISYPGKGIKRLNFAKKNTLKLLGKMYYKKNLPCLIRKSFKIKQILGIIENISRGAGIGRQAALRRQCL